MMWYYNYRCVQTNVLHWEVYKMTNEEYIKQINEILNFFSNEALEFVLKLLKGMQGKRE